MSDEPEPPAGTSEADLELQREILRGRTFSMAEALGRMAGPGGMKGASPISLLQQAQAEVGQWVRQHLTDTQGGLSAVLIREIGESRTLLDHQEQPVVAIAEYLRQVLATDPLLTELVRMADMEWGRIQGERPFFEREGRPPHPDDPYTIESVRGTLTQLQAVLAAG